MQAASRTAVEITEDKFSELALGMDAAGLSAYAGQLSTLARLLLRESTLRKHLSDPTATPAAKQALAVRLFAVRLDAPTLELLKAAVAQRWSTSRDLAITLNRFARLAILIEAERAGRIEEVTDELFRFGRLLAANPRLATLLSDSTTASDGRIRLLRRLVESKISGLTARLLEDVLRWPKTDHLAAVVDSLAELAAGRRGESVAHVVAATPLTDQQHVRLTSVLARIYGRGISVQLVVDPEVLGGLRITVGDEVIDGTVVARLTAAAHHLPGASLEHRHQT